MLVVPWSTALKSAATGARAAELRGSGTSTIDDTLRTRELVKIQLAKTTDETPKVAAGRLADATTSEVVQVIGRTVTLYRWNPELQRKGNVPPWRS